MSLSEESRRRHGLALVRRTIAAGKHTKADVARWKKEFRPSEIDQILADLEPKAGSSASASKAKE